MIWEEAATRPATQIQDRAWTRHGLGPLGRNALEVGQFDLNIWVCPPEIRAHQVTTCHHLNPTFDLNYWHLRIFGPRGRNARSPIWMVSLPACYEERHKLPGFRRVCHKSCCHMLQGGRILGKHPRVQTPLLWDSSQNHLPIHRFTMAFLFLLRFLIVSTTFGFLALCDGSLAM